MHRQSTHMSLAPYGNLLPLDEQGESRGTSVGLWTSPVTVGRRRTCHIVVDDCRVSARHCELTLKDGEWFICDLGTTNGTRVNGQTIQGAVRLRTGDTIRIGGQNFAIQFIEEQN